MSLKDLKSLNKGAILGMLWVILNPLILVGAYVIIVSFVFKVKGSGDSHFDYAIYVLSGMIPWQLITRSLQAAPVLVRQKMEIVKQVIFPIEVLPLTTLASTFVGLSVSLIIFLFLSLFNGSIQLTWLLLPIPLFFLILFIVGVSWAFSIIGVIVKDLKEIISVTLGLLVYLSPVIAKKDMVGEKVWDLIYLNPLTHPVICFRDIFYADFHLNSWIFFILMSLLSFFIGAIIINKTKVLINEYI